jgi:pyruvate formate lyase activating enzyme
MEEELKGLIFDVQGYSVHDGPGCRTLVFMKGCPLHCEWCSNPEGIQPVPELLFYSSSCTNRSGGCSRCLAACPHQAIRQNPQTEAEAPQLLFKRSRCAACPGRECLAACFFEGLRSCGEWWTVAGLLHVLERNRPYWGPGGGASFSGGEPLLQAEFMRAIFGACRAAGIHIAVETTAHIPTEIFLALMGLVDFAFIDLKHMDGWRHLEMTGVRNDLILENIAALGRSAWPGRLVLRLPVVEGFNDGPENIAAAADFMQRLGLGEINLLPFHRLGASKWAQLGRTYRFAGQPPPPPEKLLRIQDAFLSRRIACYVGADTPF